MPTRVAGDLPDGWQDWASAQGRPCRPVGAGSSTGVGTSGERCGSGGITIEDGLTVMDPALTGGTVAPPKPFPVNGRGGAVGPTTPRPGPVMAGAGPTTGSPPAGTPGMARRPPGRGRVGPAEGTGECGLPDFAPPNEAHGSPHTAILRATVVWVSCSSAMSASTSGLDAAGTWVRSAYN